MSLFFSTLKNRVWLCRVGIMQCILLTTVPVDVVTFVECTVQSREVPNGGKQSIKDKQ